jgi:hypothetical protein
LHKHIVIDDIEVDVDSLYSITHQCIPGTCKRKHCCCLKYEICIEGRELDRIINYLPEAARFAPHLDHGPEFENVFEEEGDGLYSIDAEEDGLCRFAYVNEKQHILCSLHSAALDLQLPPHKVKPLSCVTWPLAISAEPPLQLSIADDAFEFPCNIPEKQNASMDPHIADIIRDVFGERFLMRIEEAKK